MTEYRELPVQAVYGGRTLSPAFRIEGDTVNAYLAVGDGLRTLVDTWFGSISRQIAENNPSLYGAWRVLMLQHIAYEIERATGTRPVLDIDTLMP